MSELCVDLAIPNTVDKLFTYRVPASLAGLARPCVRVLAPFGKRTVVGVIVGSNTVPAAAVKLRPLIDIIDAAPIIPDELFQLAQWIAQYYFAPLGDVLKSILIPDMISPGKRMVRLVNAGADTAAGRPLLPSKQTKILRHLHEHGPLEISQLKKLAGAGSLYGELNKLVGQNIVRIDEQISHRSILPTYEYDITLTEEQRAAINLGLTQTNNRLGPGQISLMRFLAGQSASSAPISVSEALKVAGCTMSTLRSLERRNFLKLNRREVNRFERERELEPALEMIETPLNGDQREALTTIRCGMSRDTFAAYLLHGVTGSGKTHIYIEAVRETLDRGKNAIVLVPEISLTSQIVNRFRRRFGRQVVAFHSKMSHGERSDAWRLMRAGTYRVVIGPRSAIFAPLNNIGLIVVDEEQEAAYKQFDQSPRYHARDVAVVRGRGCNALVILGSATPSVESYANALGGKYTLLELPNRVDGAKLPEVTVVDMTAERKHTIALLRKQREAEIEKNKGGVIPPFTPHTFSMISDLLKTRIEDRLNKKEGIILLQNRRGYSSFVECPECGFVEMCERCSITLTYHRVQHHLRCHYCGFTKTPVDRCPTCGGVDVRYRGIGTQRVEDELGRLFPEARILRMDLDTTSRTKSHERILRTFSEGAADILIGTQMVAKGLDFSRVTLVGVISADTQMLLPDFRSSERTFQLLTQVAGRAGRSLLEGEVVIQTFLADHESLRHVPRHDFVSFYHDELDHRKELRYPPFAQLVKIEFKGKKEAAVTRAASEFSSHLRKSIQPGSILGPAPAVIEKIQGMHRRHLVIKSLKSEDPGGHKLHRAVAAALRAYKESPVGRSASVNVLVDVDPVGMM